MFTNMTVSMSSSDTAMSGGPDSAIESGERSPPPPLSASGRAESIDSLSGFLANRPVLDTCVTVLDAAQLMASMNDIRAASALDQAGVESSADSSPSDRQPTIANLMLDQIEFANVLLLNKCDLINSTSELDRMEELLHALNPSATVYRTTNSDIAVDKIVGTGLFTMDHARSLPGEQVGWGVGCLGAGGCLLMKGSTSCNACASPWV